MLFCIRKPKVGKHISATFYGFYFLFHSCFQRRVGATRIVDILYISVDLIKRSTRKDCHTGLTPNRDLWQNCRADPPIHCSSSPMPAPKPPAFETLSLHAGQHPDPVTGARAVPIYQTTSYVFQDSEHAAALFNLERAGHIYTRISNPTTAVLEERLAELEGGVGAICTASGMAALHLAIATLMNAGDHIVASSSLYGGTINLLAHTLPRFGITTTFVKPPALDQFPASPRPGVGAPIGHPGLEVLDIPEVADIAHGAKIPLLIDNPFATPYLSRP